MSEYTTTVRPYRVVEQAAPTVEPVTAAEAKLHLRIDHADEDTYIGTLISAARRWCEAYTRRAFITRSHILYLDCFTNEIRLPLGRTSSVTNVKYLAVDDSFPTLTTVSSSIYYTDIYSEPARLSIAYGNVWPTPRTDVPNTVQVTYVPGYGSAATNVPETIKQAILLLVANLYEFREPSVTGTIVAKVEFTLQALLNPHRVLEFI